MPATNNPDPLYTNERRRRFTRRYFEASGSAGTTLAALPTGGVRTAGSTIVCQAPILSLTTGVGANRIVQVCEQHGQDFDLFSINGASFWDLEHYVSCRMGHQDATNFANPTATMYAGVEMVAYLTTPPFPVPPNSIASADGCVHLRARLDTGAWELLQDNDTVSRVDVLNGVVAYNPASTPVRLEIFYTQNYVSAAINGVEGTRVPNIMINQSLGMSHVGSGVFITSGSNAAGNQTMLFYDFLADTIFPD